MIDLLLAILHHFLVFGLFAMLMAELVLTRPGMSGADAARVARLDAGYGVSAGLILLVGAARVIWGGKGWPYYADNHAFWAKMVAFALVGLLSIPPTLRFLAWRKAVAADPGYGPAPAEITRIRMYLHVQLLLMLAVIAFAATMARYG